MSFEFIGYINRIIFLFGNFFDYFMKSFKTLVDSQWVYTIVIITVPRKAKWIDSTCKNHFRWRCPWCCPRDPRDRKPEPVACDSWATPWRPVYLKNPLALATCSYLSLANSLSVHAVFLAERVCLRRLAIRVRHFCSIWGRCRADH